MRVPAALTRADLEAFEPDHGRLRHYLVSIRNHDSGEAEKHVLHAVSVAKAKAAAALRMTMKPRGDLLTFDVVRLDDV